MSGRPLWRTGTKQAIKRVKEDQAVQRAFLAECDLSLLLAEVVVRGYSVTPPMVKLNGGEGERPDYGSHICVDGKVKPYDWLLCSRCPSPPPASELNGGEDGVYEANALGKLDGVRERAIRFAQILNEGHLPPLADEDE